MAAYIEDSDFINIRLLTTGFCLPLMRLISGGGSAVLFVPVGRLRLCLLDFDFSLCPRDSAAFAIEILCGDGSVGEHGGLAASLLSISGRTLANGGDDGSVLLIIQFIQ